MNFSLADSDCWDSNPLQDNFIKNYRRKRTNSGICDTGSEPQKKKERKSCESQKKSNGIVGSKNDSARKNTNSSNNLTENNFTGKSIHNEKKTSNAKRIANKVEKKNVYSINLNGSSDLPVINDKTNSIQSKFMEFANSQSPKQHSQTISDRKEPFKTKKNKFEIEAINPIQSELNISNSIVMQTNSLTKSKVKKIKKKKAKKQEKCEKAALNSFQTILNDKFTKDESACNNEDKVRRGSSLFPVNKVTSQNVSTVTVKKNKEKGKYNSKIIVQSLSFKSNETQSDEEIDKALEDELKNSEEFKNLAQFLNDEESMKINEKHEHTAINETSRKLSENEGTVTIKSKNHCKAIHIELDLATNHRDKFPPNKGNKSCTLKSKAQQRLQAAKFRLLNEKLYTVTGSHAMEYFQNNVDEFKDYHEGYYTQVMKWQINPVDVIIKDLYQKNTSLIIADMGCGEAKIARTFPDRKVHSFDLVALNKFVTCCDISKVNLKKDSVDIVVFCLSLMGINVKDYLFEAHRILKFGGLLKIAEVESRIDDLTTFVKSIENFGFTLVNKDVAHKMFVFLDFNKVKKKLKKENMTEIPLKPCLYKKR